MKKTYINPKMVIVKIQTVQMLANSLDMKDSPSSTPTPGTTLSRRGNLWDDEDEEYEDY